LEGSIIDFTESDMGGYKEVVLLIEGRGAYGLLKFEAGVHRVQRVPITESSGRIHTSAASVVVLPEYEDVKLEIKDEDLRIETFRRGERVDSTLTKPNPPLGSRIYPRE